jgi:hypothetical protein
MPRRSNQSNGAVNKYALIREQLGRDPKMPVKDIVAMLGQRGVKVQPSLVYFLKSKMKRQRRKQARIKAVESGQRAGITNAADLVLRVKTLAREAGGLTNLKNLVEVLAE